MIRASLLAALFFLCAQILQVGPAQAAGPTMCSTRINGKDVPMGYDKDEESLQENYGMREVMFTRWGRDTCPSYVVLRSLTPDLTDEQRKPFCLQYDKESDSILGYDLGERDPYGRCEKPSASVCQRVNQTKDAAKALTGAATRGAVGGLQALPDGSGAVILNGSKGYIASALTSMGEAAAAVAASPVLLTGAAVSVVAVGGAVYACRDEAPR